VTVAVRVDIRDSAATPERLDELTRLLRSELSAAGVRDISVPTTPAPAGSRAGTVEVLGALVLALPPSMQMLPAVLETMQQWLLTTGRRASVRVELDGDVLELKNAPRDVVLQAAKTWLDRHAPK
jgi:hypothetical protein